jgi:hypothetical protein
MIKENFAMEFGGYSGMGLGGFAGRKFKGLEIRSKWNSKETVMESSQTQVGSIGRRSPPFVN